MERAKIMFSAINYHGNSKQNYNEVSPYPYKRGTVKRQYIPNVGEDCEDQILFITVVRNVG